MNASSPGGNWWRRMAERLPACGAVPVGAWEAGMMRFFFGLLILVTLPQLSACTAAPFPIGIARWTDLTWMASPMAEKFLRSLVLLLVIAYVACGRQVAVSVSLGTLLVLFDTLYNSGGAVGHSRQMVSLILFAQAAAGFGAAANEEPAEWRARWLQFSKIAFASVYLVSVCSKLVKSGGSWLWDSHLFAWDIVRVHRQNFYNALDPAWAAIPESAQWIAAHPVASTLLFDFGLLVEVSTILLLWRSRTVALVVGLSCIALHAGIDKVLGLSFPIFIACAFIFLVNPTGWLLALGDQLRTKWLGGPRESR